MKNPNNLEYQPTQTITSHQIIGKTALTSDNDTRTESLPEAKNLANYRKRLIDDGYFPIETREGSDKCYEFLLSQAIDDDFNSKGRSVSRQLKLEGYKNPDWSEQDTTEIFQNASVDVVLHILSAIRNAYQEHGIDAVQAQFPKIKTSGTDWTQILTTSKRSLLDCYRDPTNPNITPSLKTILKCCNLMEEHAGNIIECPYDIPTRTNNIVPADQAQFSDGKYRIYFSSPSGKPRAEFLTTYAKKCIDEKIPFDMKGMERPNREPGSAPSYFDSTVFYVLPDHLEKTIKILEEIKQESPDLIAKFGSPITTADNMGYYTVAQSRKQATWNYLFDRVSKWAFYKTIASQMSLEGLANDNEHAAYLQENAGFKLSITEPILPEEMQNYIHAKSGSLNMTALKSMFFINLKQLFSLTNFGDTKHTEYPFCFSKTYYSPAENNKKSPDS